MHKKKKGYFGNIRQELVDLVQEGNNKILEIGCGEGNTGKVLKEQGKAIEIVGIEIIYEAAQIAKRKIDKVLNIDVEKTELPFDEGYFDYVIMGDVLEHLYDPWLLVRKLSRFIKNGGYIVVSIPNIRHWKVLKELVLKGEWKYSVEGPLDDTHLRFFTKKSMISLLESGPFTVSRIIPVSKFRPNLGIKWSMVNKLTLGLLEEFLEAQYIIEAKKLCL